MAAMTGFILLLTWPALIAGFCFDEYMTKLSRYAHHGSPEEIDEAFSQLRDIGITRVDFNVWADGNLYFNSPTARAQGASYRGENLQWAVDAGKKYGIQIFAWFEYGSMAGFGNQLNPFAQHADENGWMLYNVRNGEKVYTSDGQGAGSFTYLNPLNLEVQDFLANLYADSVRYYGVDGIQIGDHVRWPNGFDILQNYTKSERFETMETLMKKVRVTLKEANPNAVLAFSPAPLLFAQDNHNVNWTSWLQDGLVDNMLPQYYRTNSASFEAGLDEDLGLLSGPLDFFYACVRLSGAQEPPITPQEEVDRMINITDSRRLKGLSFWFVDNLLDGSYSATPNCSS